MRWTSLLMMGMRQQKRKDSSIRFLCSLSGTRKVFMFCMQHQELNKCIGLMDVPGITVAVKGV